MPLLQCVVVHDFIAMEDAPVASMKAKTQLLACHRIAGSCQQRNRCFCVVWQYRMRSLQALFCFGEVSEDICVPGCCNVAESRKDLSSSLTSGAQQRRGRRHLVQFAILEPPIMPWLWHGKTHCGIAQYRGRVEEGS